ncbi:MAG: cyclase family protein [Spirochaetota bacterium]
MRLKTINICLTQARIIDLSKKVEPGKATGPFETGNRKYEIEPFTYPPGELMHYIQMESHISTHVEAPNHYVTPRYQKKAKDISEIPLERFFGMAIFVNCKDLPARTAIGIEILEKAKIKKNDIVLFGNSSHTEAHRCYLSKEGAEYLVQKSIKMAGIDDTVFGENPEFRHKVFENYFTHDLLLKNDIPLIEGLTNLDQLRKERFFFIGIPAKMGGLESFPIRAVAIEVQPA